MALIFCSYGYHIVSCIQLELWIVTMISGLPLNLIILSVKHSERPMKFSSGAPIKLILFYPI